MRSQRMAAVTMACVALALAGAAPRGPREPILRAEIERIADVSRSLSRPAPAAEQPLPPGTRRRGGEPCGAGGQREVRVASADELLAALAAARPGDHIALADGVYRGRFELARSGTAQAPITLCGSRAAVLEPRTAGSGYGLHLVADHWILVGFAVSDASKGIVTDGASHNLLRGLEVRGIGEEGVHFRRFSHDNRIEGCWIHDVGLVAPWFGEGVYIGSARSNWAEHGNGGPDACDRNEVLDNVIGPGVRAEGVDAKEGTRGGTIAGNVFLCDSTTAADSWVDLKGDDYIVERNRGTHDPTRPFGSPVMVFRSPDGWGEGNRVGGHAAVELGPLDGAAAFRVARGGAGAVTLALPRRALPYALDELRVCFPQSLEQVEPGVLLLHEHLLAGPGARLEIRDRDARELRLRSAPRSFASVVGVRGEIGIAGSRDRRVWIRSWDPRRNAPDRASADGRAYLAMFGGRMDLHHVEVTDLGFGTGVLSGAGWRGRADAKCRGDVIESRFARNYFGAYTFQSDSMRWVGNDFADNEVYGFDPHDDSDHFIVTGNRAHGNPRHGIIFSRGCRGNVVSRNLSYSNGGHGIMLDDGRVADDGDPRHAHGIPPTANLLEENEVWGNDVGIFLQGGRNNVVRANVIRANRSGIRLDQSDDNRFIGNDIRDTRDFAVHVLAGSDRNHILENRIHGGQGGIVVRNSQSNVIRGNAITGIVGQGITVAGSAGRTTISENRIVGRGARAIDLRDARGPDKPSVAGNRTQGWLPRREPLPAMMLWSTIVGLPVVMSGLAWTRRRKRPRRGRGLPAGAAVVAALLASSDPAAAAPGRTLTVTASVSAVRDDNVFKYSDAQLRDLATGTSTYRYGFSRPEDVVLGPALALQWQEDRGGGRRRSLRVRGEGALYGSHAAANFGAVDATWREGFAGARRLSLAYGYAPDRLLRRLYDADLTSLPATERYRDARYDAHGGSAAWRHAVPRATWLEWTYQFDRRRYEPGFRERDSDFHVGQVMLGWEGWPRGGQLRVSGGHTWRLARAEDGDPGGEPDLSYHGPLGSVDGHMDLRAVGAARLSGDAAYDVEYRVHDSERANDLANRGRRDLVQAVELGLRLEQPRRWSARAFYRLGRSRAKLGTSAPLDSEPGSYDVNQIGLTLEWTSEVRSRY